MIELDDNTITLAALFVFNVCGLTYFFYLLWKRKMELNSKSGAPLLKTKSDIPATPAANAQINPAPEKTIIERTPQEVVPAPSLSNGLSMVIGKAMSAFKKEDAGQVSVSNPTYSDISNSNLKHKIIENEQLIHKLFQEIENHLKIQTELVNQNLELN
jgi:hypothetical protein